MKRIFYAAAAVMTLVSCGNTIGLASGEQSGDTPESRVTGTTSAETTDENSHTETTAADVQKTTEPERERCPEPVEIDVHMPEGYQLSQSKVIEGFNTVMQTPELPTGCEIVALTETLNFYGFGADKIEMCDTFLPVDKMAVQTMDEAYIGDPYSDDGFGCTAVCITATANDYFDYLGSDWYAVDLTGISFQEMLYQVDQGRPAIVWSTIDQRESYPQYVDVLGRNFNYWQHCLAVYGYDLEKKQVHCADPLVGNVAYDMDRFERIYNVMERQTVILCGNEESAGKDYTTDEEKKKWLEENRPEESEEPEEPEEPEEVREQ